MAESNEFKSIGLSGQAVPGQAGASCVTYLKGRRYVSGCAEPQTNGKMSLDYWSQVVDMMLAGGSGNGP